MAGAADIDDRQSADQLSRPAGDVPSICAGPKIDIGYQATQVAASAFKDFDAFGASFNRQDLVSSFSESGGQELLKENLVLHVQEQCNGCLLVQRQPLSGSAALTADALSNARMSHSVPRAQDIEPVNAAASRSVPQGLRTRTPPREPWRQTMRGQL